MHEEPDEVQAVLDRCSPQCMLNQEPGYVIYSAVGSFYAPMLVMMFFNWRIYRTATKTTKAIRQGWTKVKGVSGEEEIGLGIHKGGGGGSRTQSKFKQTETAGSKQRPGKSRSSRSSQLNSNSKKHQKALPHLNAAMGKATFINRYPNFGWSPRP